MPRVTLLQQKILELVEELHKTHDSFKTGWSHERNEEMAKTWETAFSRSKPPARLRVAEQSALAAEEAEVADSEGDSIESLQEAEMARLEDGLTHHEQLASYGGPKSTRSESTNCSASIAEAKVVDLGSEEHAREATDTQDKTLSSHTVTSSDEQPNDKEFQGSQRHALTLR